MRKSAKKRIDIFFEDCQRNIRTLSPEKVREKLSRYYDEEKIDYFSLKLKKLLSDNPSFSRRFNGESEEVFETSENSFQDDKPEEENTLEEEIDIVTLNRSATHFCGSVLFYF